MISPIRDMISQYQIAWADFSSICAAITVSAGSRIASRRRGACRQSQARRDIVPPDSEHRHACDAIAKAGLARYEFPRGRIGAGHQFSPRVLTGRGREFRLQHSPGRQYSDTRRAGQTLRTNAVARVTAHGIVISVGVVIGGSVPHEHPDTAGSVDWHTRFKCNCRGSTIAYVTKIAFQIKVPLKSLDRFLRQLFEIRVPFVTQVQARHGRTMGIREPRQPPVILAASPLVQKYSQALIEAGIIRIVIDFPPQHATPREPAWPRRAKRCARAHARVFGRARPELADIDAGLI